MIIADTSGLLAWFNRTEPEHESVRRVIARQPDAMVVSPYVVAELDSLVATRVGVAAELAMLEELGSGAYVLPGIEAADLGRLADVVRRYQDQGIGLTDASLVLLAERFGTREVLTLDRRHFSVIRPLSGGRFRLLPSALKQ